MCFLVETIRSLCIHYLYTCICMQSPSNQENFFGYRMCVDDHYKLMMKGVMGKQITYMALIGVHLTMHLNY